MLTSTPRPLEGLFLTVRGDVNRPFEGLLKTFKCLSIKTFTERCDGDKHSDGNPSKRPLKALFEIFKKSLKGLLKVF
jgi:hypothetical protein